MNQSAPPIAKLAERLMLDVEQAVRRFPRFHKYALGAELREQVRNAMRLINRAWRQRSNAREHVFALTWAVDDIKQSLQLGKELQAFASFKQWEAIAKLANELGAQCGGWYRQLCGKGQNDAPPAAAAPRQRAQILSPLAASHEAAR